MAQFPCLPLWTDAWMADTAHLSRKERGTYIDLIILMWRTPGCRVPNDNGWLAKHMRMYPAEVERELRPIIREFCQSDGNYLCQKRLQKEFVRAFKQSQKQSVRAKSRWNKDKGLCRGNASVALPPNHIPRRESYCGREEEEAADKKNEVQISAELYQLVAAKK